MRAFLEEWVSQLGCVAEWRAKRWRLNNANCADFAEILVPLSQSPGISMNQKTQMIGKFLEVTTTWDELLSVSVTDDIPCVVHA